MLVRKAARMENHNEAPRTTPPARTRFLDATPGSVIAVEVVEPTAEQLDAATERLATLIADLWVRGLLVRPEDNDGSEG